MFIVAIESRSKPGQIAGGSFEGLKAITHNTTVRARTNITPSSNNGITLTLKNQAPRLRFNVCGNIWDLFLWRDVLLLFQPCFSSCFNSVCLVDVGSVFMNLIGSVAFRSRKLSRYLKLCYDCDRFKVVALLLLF